MSRVTITDRIRDLAEVYASKLEYYGPKAAETNLVQLVEAIVPLEDGPIAFIAQLHATSHSRLVWRTDVLRNDRGVSYTPLFTHPTEAVDLLRQVIKEADSRAVAMGVKVSDLFEEGNLLARIRTYVEGLPDA